MDLISVIVPVYNAAPYLPDCLDSILKQTYDNIEVVAVDDGSTDDSGTILDNYHKNHPDKIKVIHKENGGVTSARLTGVRSSKGEWIGFVDADDEIEPDMYERLHQNARQYHAEISHCGYQTIVNDGERIHLFYNTGKIVLEDRQEGLKDLLVGSMEPGLWNKLFHKSLFEKLINSFVMDESIKYNEDLLMNYYLFHEAELSVFEDFCAYHYMSRDSTATRGSFNLKKLTDPVVVAKHILDDSSADLKDDAWRRYLTCCFRAYFALHDRIEYAEQTKVLQLELTENRDKWNLLSKRERVKLFMVLKSPKLYSQIYHFYEKYFQLKQYE